MKTEFKAENIIECWHFGLLEKFNNLTNSQLLKALQISPHQFCISFKIFCFNHLLFVFYRFNCQKAIALILLFNQPKENVLSGAEVKPKKLQFKDKKKINYHLQDCYKFFHQVHLACGCERYHDLEYLLSLLEAMPKFQKEMPKVDVVSTELVPRYLKIW